MWPRSILRSWLLISGAQLVLATAARTQGEPLYRPFHVPPSITLEQDVQAGAPAGVPSGVPDPIAATTVALDASHFTPSANPNVRDLDGDGHLDGTWLFEGVHVWLGRGDGRFDTGTFQPSNVPPYQSQIVGQWGDVDGDGRLDAIFVENTEVEIFFDQGDGSFLDSGPLVLAVGTTWFAVAAADMNDDGFVDLVVRHNPGGISPSLGILYGTGSPHGWFGPPVTIATTKDNLTAVAAGDFDGNGLLDVVAFGDLVSPQPSIGTWTQGPPGSFTAHAPLPLSFFGIGQLEAHDLTGDGFDDVLFHMDTQVILFIADGSGSLSPSFVLPGVKGGARFDDVDQDGLVDVLQQESATPYGVQVLLAHADGLSSPVETRHSAQPIGTGDFDEDGQLDLWSPDAALLGHGDGSFLGARNFFIGTDGEAAQRLAYADFNEDGTPDLVTVDDGFGIFATLSDVGATWRPPLGVNPTMASISVATGDLDGDGHEDILAARAFVGNADICLGNGSGGFQIFPIQDYLALGNGEKTGVGIGQFDLSSPADVVSCSPNGLISVRLGLGNLGFGAIRVTNMPAGFGGSPWLLVRDLDGDGLDDLLVLQGSGVYSFRSVGNGFFAPPVAVTTFARNLTVADIDGDGDDDLVAVDDLPTGDQLVSALIGDGAGHFAAAPFAAIDPELTPRGAAVADVDGDGLTDLALGHDRAWSLHLGQPGGGWAPEPADLFDLPAAGFALRFIDADIDGRPDLLLAGTVDPDFFLETGIGLTLALHQGGPWEDLGHGLTTTASKPFLFPEGSLQPGTPMALVLRDGPPSAPAWFILGLAELNLPFKGGLLVPAPLLLLPAPILSPSGIKTLSATWPAGVPAGTRLWVQGWIADAAGPAGFAASNAVVGTTP
jgi:hypothetical protein